MSYRSDPTLYMREWRKRNPEKNRIYCRKYYVDNREKELLRKKEDFLKFKSAGYSDKRRMYQRLNCRYRRLAAKCESPLTQKEWMDILDAADYKCSECSSTEDLTMDHLIPISKGGLHTKSNIGVKCRKCNSVKGSKIII
jgi:5-methylcytosine-specific restriction endonuclease McrA